MKRALAIAAGFLLVCVFASTALAQTVQQDFYQVGSRDELSHMNIQKLGPGGKWELKIYFREYQHDLAGIYFEFVRFSDALDVISAIERGDINGFTYWYDREHTRMFGAQPYGEILMFWDRHPHLP